ncbi:hypothetical protein T07_10284 [Trichinella nelsoni]|uniref:Uncharacterized protein n=1 Tax=Trichinella nelsoni TaxID=6336 RepID=A0A0V0RL05_9BILA|nr:hypothetical protein T07_10284 [Trichinella nelsoni]
MTSCCWLNCNQMTSLPFVEKVSVSLSNGINFETTPGDKSSNRNVENFCPDIFLHAQPGIHHQFLRLQLAFENCADDSIATPLLQKSVSFSIS